MTLSVGHLTEEQRRVLRPVVLAYRRARRAGKHPSEAHDVALAEYRRLSPDAPTDRLEASEHVNHMVAAAINANPRWFWHGPDA